MSQGKKEDLEDDTLEATEIERRKGLRAESSFFKVILCLLSLAISRIRYK